MKTENRKVYITDDGKEFDNENKAKHHELILRSAEVIAEVEKFLLVAATGREAILDEDGQLDDDQLADFYEAIPTHNKPFDEIDTPYDLAVIIVNMFTASNGLVMEAMHLAEKLLSGE